MYKNADPRLTYFVLNRVDLAKKQEQVLTRLYQPLIVLGCNVIIFNFS